MPKSRTPNIRTYSTVVPSSGEAPSPWVLALRRAMIVPLVLGMLATAGCGGCDSQPANNSQTAQQGEDGEDGEDKKPKPEAEKKKKPPLEVKPLLPLVGEEPAPVDDEESPPKNSGLGLFVKPGHWTTTVQEMQTNYDDFVGQNSLTLVDPRMRPIPLDYTNFTYQTTRPVALAKGRMKRVEGELLVPEQSKGNQIRAELRDRNSGALLEVPQPLVRKIPSYQYYIVVLSKEISKYGFLKVTDAVRMPWEEEMEAVSQPHYRVVLADATKAIPLPGNAITWTGVSHLFWDEVDPTRLTPEQQTALVDWLHWGGRIIINGPDSLDGLRTSFLADYLPADMTGPRNFNADDLAEWSNYWLRRQRGLDLPAITPAKPWSGVALKPRAATSELAGGSQLFYERTVGRGSIVLSAVQLAERDLINWPGYDSFLNAGLLRRPNRMISEGPLGGPRIDWVDYRSHRLDAHLVTGLRWFARDSGAKANQWSVEERADNLFQQFDTVTTTKVDRLGGLGTWTEFSPVADAARAVLTDAAAVRVPGAGFVLGCLAFYLLVLVPVNWMAFRALNRVEWAWIAAPIIALLGTLVIVRQAQLDIGFVRSQTEVALLELQGTHPRGLLSRFTALYSSLSTTYDVTYDSPTTVATPFPASPDVGRNINESIWDVVLEKQDKTKLSGLAVSSASTKMVHSEELFELTGALKIGRSTRGHEQLENHLGYNLRDVVVVRRFFDAAGEARYESSWIGDLRDGESGVLGLQPLAIIENSTPHQQERQQAATERNSSIDVAGLMDIAFQFPKAEDPYEQRREELRVVGIIDQVLPGSEVAPAASQILGATVVLAHLNYGALPVPLPDVNCRSDVLKLKPSSFGSEEEDSFSDESP